MFFSGLAVAFLVAHWKRSAGIWIDLNMQNRHDVILNTLMVAVNVFTAMDQFQASALQFVCYLSNVICKINIDWFGKNAWIAHKGRTPTYLGIDFQVPTNMPGAVLSSLLHLQKGLTNFLLKESQASEIWWSSNHSCFTCHFSLKDSANAVLCFISNCVCSAVTLSMIKAHFWYHLHLCNALTWNFHCHNTFNGYH